MKEALAISWNIIDKKIFTFYFNSKYNPTTTKFTACTGFTYAYGL
jgi:hypothetical protein